ncbi:hypothetical protein B0T22DRAFT_463896 [Podospora appendiculata]|uniref:SnoaL-like domain-containing protein n=1 Tax=Podospora appendiculata TaxID=314037 RepID=A0AAE1CE97_9PEZI|nr:hypothetical protein B0T22DRAFT_463896 [Podospora appendiculata]
MATPQVNPWVMPEVMKLPVIISPPSHSDREAITDCIHRLILGLDTNDSELFDSALAEDAKWELHIKTLQNRQEIHEQSYDTDIVKLDTTHYVTNIRIHMADSGSEASVSTMYEAHHYRGGRGTIPGAARYSTGGVYFLRLVRDADDAGGWRINYMKMKPIWTEGDRLLVMQH